MKNIFLKKFHGMEKSVHKFNFLKKFLKTQSSIFGNDEYHKMRICDLNPIKNEKCVISLVL